MPLEDQDRAVKLAALINQSHQAGQAVDPAWFGELNGLAAAGNPEAQRMLAEFARSGIVGEMNFGAPTPAQEQRLGQTQTGEPSIGWGDLAAPAAAIPEAIWSGLSALPETRRRYRQWLQGSQTPWFGEAMYRMAQVSRELGRENKNTSPTLQAYEQGYGPFTGGEAVMAQRFAEHPLFYQMVGADVNRYQQQYDEWAAQQGLPPMGPPTPVRSAFVDEFRRLTGMQDRERR
jgi:hypothetical protein